MRKQQVGDIWCSPVGVIKILSRDTFVWLRATDHNNLGPHKNDNILTMDLEAAGWVLDDTSIVDAILTKYNGE